MTDVSRRAFLATTALGAGLTGLTPAAAAEDDLTDLVDAHVHVWTPDTAAWPLAEGATKADMQPPSFTAEELLATCRPHGVSRVVLIQMSFYGTDNRYMLDCIHRHAPAFSGVAIIDHEKPDVAGEMRALKERGVRGFRLYADRKHAQAWSDSAGMKAMWECGADENLAMCLLADPDALPAIAAQVARYPTTPVVIDHFARLGMKGGLESPEGRADLQRLVTLADHEQVNVKVSATLRDAYGSKRLMWATDCPYQLDRGPAGEEHSYAASLSLVRDRLDFLSREERLDVLRNTARRVFFDGAA
jgi:predicted TIM-barrel fold metal-dependent hydrolase